MKIRVLFYFVYFSTLARPRYLSPRDLAARGGSQGVQTNWHARWDMVLLPSLLSCGRPIRFHSSSDKHSMLFDDPRSGAVFNEWSPFLQEDHQTL